MAASFLSAAVKSLLPWVARSSWIAWLALAASIALALVSWRHETDSDDREAALHFESAAIEVGNAVRERMAAYEQILRGGAALFSASASVERDEWKSYVEALRLQQRFPGIQGMGFAQVVSAGERDAHTRAIRAEGFPDYAIHPEGERPEYTPIVYIEPFSGRNLQAFGYDMFSEPVRRAAMERARDTGEAALSGKVSLIQETSLDMQAGCLLYLPVYRNGAPHASVAQRRAALAGYVYAPFRMKNLMTGILGARAQHLDLEIYDGTKLSSDALMYDDRRRGSAPPRFMRDLALELSGGTWTLRLSSTPEFDAQIATAYPRWILIGGISTSMLIFLLAAALIGLCKQSLVLTARDAELSRSRERLAFLLRATPAVIYAAKTDGDHGATFISANIRRQLGYAPEDFLDDPGFWANNIHPDDRERVFAGLAALGNEGSHTHEYRFRHRDGSWRWMRDEVTLIRDPAGVPQELVGSRIDITARKQAEDLLLESEARHQAVIESALDAIIVNDQEGRIAEFNPAAERTFGYPREQAIGRNLADLLIPPADGGILRRRFTQSLASGTPEFGGRRVEVSALHADGHEFPLELAVQRIDRGGRMFFTAFARDVTEIKRAEAAMAEALRAKTEFMNNVTHELRTPLNAVIGFAELLRDEVPGPLNAQQAEFAADILASGQHLLGLVKGILEMSRLDAAGAVLEREAVDIGAALEERVAAKRQVAGARGVTIELEVAADAGGAELDPKALRRMVDALLDNAIKFNREGGTVAVSARRAGGWIEIAVTDTGVGIAPEDLAKLFRPLVQLDAGLARRHGGIGLGLALARRLAELHGGTIEVESENGKGSTFTLRFPMQEDS